MRTIAGLIFALFIIVGAALSGRVAAAELAAPDQEAIRGIISSQIEAFQRDDGAAAYGFASPTIHGLYPTADQFMGMVRNSYQPVYRPQSVTFGQITAGPYGPMQKVFLTGPDGRNWVAIYSLQRQPDGSWKINGCTLVEDDGATI